MRPLNGELEHWVMQGRDIAQSTQFVRFEPTSCTSGHIDRK